MYRQQLRLLLGGLLRHVRACPAGQQFSARRSCVPCPAGKYKAVDGPGVCRTCTRCGVGTVLSRACGGSSDAECACRDEAGSLSLGRDGEVKT